MTAWDPPREDGLAAGGRHLPEEVERAGYTPTDCHAPGVYILRCSHPNEDRDALADRWRRTTDHDHVPPYLEDIAQADALFYVGAASNVYERLDDHVHGDARQVAFCAVFPAHSLKSVWFDADPFVRESGVATMLQNHRPDAYVHQR